MRAVLEFTDSELDLIKDALVDAGNQLQTASYAASMRHNVAELRARGEHMSRLAGQIRFAVTQDPSTDPRCPR
jgi:hypothetical protein